MVNIITSTKIFCVVVRMVLMLIDARLLLQVGFHLESQTHIAAPNYLSMMILNKLKNLAAGFN